MVWMGPLLHHVGKSWVKEVVDEHPQGKLVISGH